MLFLAELLVPGLRVGQGIDPEDVTDVVFTHWHFTVAPGVDERHVPGHTPGTTVHVIFSGGRRPLLLGDAAHSVAQFSERDWGVI